MMHESETRESAARFVAKVEHILKKHSRDGSGVGLSRTPAVVDVMGGIGEDTGSLVLTATASFAIHIAVWQTSANEVRICKSSAESSYLFAFSPSLLLKGVAAVRSKCREEDAQWAEPIVLSLQKAIEDGIIPPIDGGLCFVVDSDFRTEADLGRQSVLAAATIDATCRMYGVEADRLRQSRICSCAVAEITGLNSVRKVMTALCGPTNGAILQLRFLPNLLCERLEMPEGLIIKTVATRLSRPTTLRRLVETKMCSDMGHRMIMEIQRQDGMRLDPATCRLSAITPTEYVERYRDRMPSKITRGAFIREFGALRGLNEDGADPKTVFKIRSRAEHHIYENRRVHDFVTNLVRAKRTGTLQCLIAAGDLMYASHWSHSQRCGIGGVETDRLVNFIRSHGPEAGLFGAKVTAGGEGGELVVLMRDDDRGHGALADAIKRAEQASQQEVHVFNGSLAGACSFVAPEIGGLVDSAGAV